MWCLAGQGGGLPKRTENGKDDPGQQAHLPKKPEVGTQVNPITLLFMRERNDGDY